MVETQNNLETRNRAVNYLLETRPGQLYACLWIWSKGTLSASFKVLAINCSKQ